jgi:hypothetical protein
MSDLSYLEHFFDLYLHILEIYKSFKKTLCIHPNFILGLYKNQNFEMIF